MINKERLLNTFLEYIQIDSESYHEGAFAARVAADMQAIGCQVYQDSTQDKSGSEAGNLYCTLPGNTEGKAMIFSAHMDTVVPGNGIEPVIENGIIRSKGDTVLGGDDKSGIAAIVEAMRTIVEQNLPHPTIQAVFTVCEEVGLRGSANIEYDKLVSDHALVLDSSGDAGFIITSAPGQYVINAAILGRKAHAGIAPEEGISSIQVLGEAIANMKLMRIDAETTANIGSISASYPTNIVADRAEIIAECRSRTEEKLEAQRQHMMDCLEAACAKYGAQLDATVTKPYSAFYCPDDDAFVLHVSEACRKTGLEPKLGVSGGSSDANNFSLNGVKSLVLGTGMAKVHTTDEEISIENLENTARLCLTLATV